MQKIVIDDKYIIYTDTWTVYNTENADAGIPQEVFELIEKLKNN